MYYYQDSNPLPPKMASAASDASDTAPEEQQILVLADNASNAQSLCETGNHVEGYQLSAKTYTTLKTIGHASTKAYMSAVDAYESSIPNEDQAKGLENYNKKMGLKAYLAWQNANVQAGFCPLQKNPKNPCINGSRCKSTLKHGVTEKREWSNNEKASNMWIDQNVVLKSSGDVNSFCATISDASKKALSTKQAGAFDEFCDHVSHFADILVFQLNSVKEFNKASQRNSEAIKLGTRTALQQLQGDIDALKVTLHEALPHIEEYEHKPYAGSKK